MKRKFTIRALLTAFALCATLVASAQSTPVVGDGKYYFIKSQRTNTAGYFWTFNGKDVLPQPLTKANNQKFTLVASPDGKVTIKEFGGLQLNDTNRDDSNNTALPSFDTNGVSVGFEMIENTVNGIKGFAFEGGINEGGLHQGGNSWGWRVGSSSWYDLEDYCTFFFYEAVPSFDLSIIIEEATALANSASIGITPGSTPEAAVDALNLAIVAAQEKLTSTNPTELEAATTTLNTAIATFKDAKIALVESSTAEATRWYLIKNSARGGKGGTVYVTGMEEGVKMTSATNQIPADGTGEGDTEAQLKHLFRFEKDPTGKYRIINAQYPEGELLPAAGSSEPVMYGTPRTPNSVWELKFVGSEDTYYQFNLICDGTVAHAAGTLNLVQWNEAAQMGLNQNSTWYAEAFSGTVGLREVKDLVRPIVVNKVIVANGQTVEVYSIMGVKVANVNLKQGIYIAKVGKKSYKVTVK